jgi:NTE family protein
MKRWGLALGGGGVRGLAHLLALEVLDDLGIRPVAVAGTSMGAIVGALYCSGFSGREIRQGFTDHLVLRGDDLRTVWAKRAGLVKWLKAFKPGLRQGGLFRTDSFLKPLCRELHAKTFEELKIPLRVVAADFWSGQEVVFRSGDLRPAIQASMAIPGVFAPVSWGGRVLVDGGLVNNVPHDLLAGECDAVIAVDVTPARRPGRRPVPNPLEAALGMFDMLVEQVTARRLAVSAPTLLVRPGLTNIQVLEFEKSADVFRQARPAMVKLRADLARLNR